MDIESLRVDKDYLALNKPAGVLVHGIFDKHGAKHEEETLADWAVNNYPEIKGVGEDENRPGIVHRLDRETSGVIIVVRNQEAFKYFKSLFQNREIEKEYIALVWGRMQEKNGIINKTISIRDGSVKRTVFKGKMPRAAITEYAVEGVFKDVSGNEFSLLRAKPRTGRTHQIRVHLSSLGHPVVGDKLYGKKNSPEGLQRHFLHAAVLRFKDLDGKEQKIEASLPPELVVFLGSLKKEDSDQDSD
ncbi:MAG: RluA family pseudouridine synthase [Candidatus Harrisonbacteria bacterium CG10_big_fil_rev_8_21_14_0_10_44_23]|uniref:RluA family pseudouridine synthase n=1 Tax=Candidatus Harrisonbacteria bacterium CG10_big_fil_rev_8_21_14_0_10_44_23 TaxID=1974585 RepID=A0A2H0UQV5_9BACT|nr:MAG: RluA family pseudouridine synthase [Candidatus Harrisonbacteria bacterium CG10_big_fil_rev_8_21_14_0_10_44_23]